MHTITSEGIRYLINHIQYVTTVTSRNICGVQVNLIISSEIIFFTKTLRQIVQLLKITIFSYFRAHTKQSAQYKFFALPMEAAQNLCPYNTINVATHIYVCTSIKCHSAEKVLITNYLLDSFYNVENQGRCYTWEEAKKLDFLRLPDFQSLVYHWGSRRINNGL